MKRRSTLGPGRATIIVIGFVTSLMFLPQVGVGAASPIDVACPSDSLQQAIDDAPDGARIHVTGTCVENVAIGDGKTIEIEGGHATLDGDRAGSVMTIAAGAHVYLVDGLHFTNGEAEYGGAIHNQGTLVVDTISFRDNVAYYAGGGIYNVGTLTTLESYFEANETIDDGGDGGGGAIFNGGTADIGVSFFEGNRAPDDNGGAIFNLGTIRIWDSEFTGNLSERGGAAIANGAESYSAPDGMVIEFARVVGNHGYKGAISSDGGPVTIRDSYIAQNDSYSTVLLTGGEIQMIDTLITENTASEGSAILVAEGAELHGEGLTVTLNTSRDGGGLAADGGLVTLVSSTIRDNESEVAGGGISLREGASLEASAVDVLDNTARANGGGILVKGSDATITGSEISGNRGKDGGGIANTAGSTTTVHDTLIHFNHATRQGGGVFNAGSELQLTQASVSNNVADVRAGAVGNRRASAGPGIVNAVNTTIGRNWAPEGAGIHNVDSHVTLDHVTVTENSGSPAFYEDKSPPWTTPINSIIAGNHHGDCDGSLHSGGGNVVGDCVFQTEDGDPGAQPTDLLDTDPVLVPGGPGEYFSPLPHSPVVDHLSVGDCTQTVDQRGSERPMGAGCEPGSIEFRVYPGAPTVEADFDFGATFLPGTVVLSGVAHDDEAIDRVKVGVKDRGQNRWLQDDKETWGSFNLIPAHVTDPGEPTSAWSLSVDLEEGDYSMAVRAFDKDGRHGDLVPYRHFEVAADTTDPFVSVDFDPHTVFSSPVLLSGTAEDNVGVLWVRIAIRDRVTKRWLQDDLVTWGSFNRLQADLDNPGETITVWFFELDLPNGKYSLSTKVKDTSGNTFSNNPWVPFKVT